MVLLTRRRFLAVASGLFLRGEGSHRLFPPKNPVGATATATRPEDVPPVATSTTTLPPPIPPPTTSPLVLGAGAVAFLATALAVWRARRVNRD